MTYYVLWQQTTKYAHRKYKITINQEKKDYPAKNPWVQGQYKSLQELRKENPEISKCSKCSKEIDTETRMYTTLSNDTLCSSCINTIQVCKQL